MCLLALMVCLHQEFRHNRRRMGVLLMLLHIVEVIVSVVVVVFCGGDVFTFLSSLSQQQLGGGRRGGSIGIKAYIYIVGIISKSITTQKIQVSKQVSIIYQFLVVHCGGVMKKCSLSSILFCCRL